MLSFDDSDSQCDVLVTGIGLVTPLGHSVAETWQRLTAGARAARELTYEDIDHFEALSEMQGLRVYGAPVEHAETERRLNRSGLLKSVRSKTVKAWIDEPLISMSLLALEEALRHSALPRRSANPNRTAVVFGSSKGGMRTAERMTNAFQIHRTPVMQTVGISDADTQAGRADSYSDEPDDEFGTYWISAFPTDSATRALAEITGATFSKSCPVAACATGLIALLQGAALIHSGQCDVCIVGSADAALRASVLASFHRLRVTSRHSDPASACCPFDESRDGFVIGEGAAVMILESRSHVESRGATPLARVTAGGWLNDPTGLTQIDTDGSVVAELLRRVIPHQAKWPEVIGLHGTGTVSNDLAEARGIRSYFGSSRIPDCYGIKGAIGHLLGAAASVETALTVLSLYYGQIPGTTNLQDQDPDCDIPLTSQFRSMPSLCRAAKLSLGFGGHVACGLFERA